MPKTKLSPKNVVILRGLYSIGMNVRSLSSLFGVSYEQTRRIVRGDRWKKVVVPAKDPDDEVIVQTTYRDDGD